MFWRLAAVVIRKGAEAGRLPPVWPICRCIPTAFLYNWGSLRGVYEGGSMKRLMVVLILIATAAQGEIYTWKDSRGTAHFTNRLDDIPPRYRNRAKSLNYDAGKVGEAAQPPQSGQALPVPPAPSGNGGAALRQQSLPAQPAGLTPATRLPAADGVRPVRTPRGRGGSRSAEEREE